MTFIVSPHHHHHHTPNSPPTAVVHHLPNHHLQQDHLPQHPPPSLTNNSNEPATPLSPSYPPFQHQKALMSSLNAQVPNPPSKCPYSLLPPVARSCSSVWALAPPIYHSPPPP